MDNLATQNVAGIRQTIESSGAELFYLPPYSPDLNPIEFAFSKLKSLLRKAAARTVHSLWKTIENSPTLSLHRSVNISSKPLLITVN
jgi:transposase